MKKRKERLSILSNIENNEAYCTYVHVEIDLSSSIDREVLFVFAHFHKFSEFSAPTCLDSPSAYK